METQTVKVNNNSSEEGTKTSSNQAGYNAEDHKEQYSPLDNETDENGKSPMTNYYHLHGGTFLSPFARDSHFY